MMHHAGKSTGGRLDLVGESDVEAKSRCERQYGFATSLYRDHVSHEIARQLREL